MRTSSLMLARERARSYAAPLTTLSAGRTSMSSDVAGNPLRSFSARILSMPLESQVNAHNGGCGGTTTDFFDV
jgi:hypothetical protein